MAVDARRRGAGVTIPAPPAAPEGKRLGLGRATLASAGAQVVGVLATFAATPYLVGTLGVERYGVFAAITVIGAQLTALQLGLSNAIPRRLAEVRARRDPREHAATLASVALVTLAAAALVCLAFNLAAPSLWRRALHATPDVLRLATSVLPAAAAVVAVQPMAAAAYAVLIGEERFGLLSVIRALHGLVRVAVAVTVVAYGGGLAGVLWGQVAVDLSVALAAASSLPLRAAVSALPSARPAVGRLLAVGIPFAGADLVNSLLWDAEKLVVGMTGPIRDFTYYTVSFSAVMRMTILAAVLSSLLVPRLARMAAGGELESAGRLTHQSTRLLTACMMLLAAPLAALAPDLLRLWMGPDFALHGGLPARLLLIGLVVNTSVYAANAAVLARARPMVLPLLYLAELVLHLACVAVAVRLWGLPGAAAAWVFRASIDAAAQRILAARALGVSIGPWREFAIPFAALVSVVLFCQVAAPDAAWWMRLAVGGAVSVGVAAWLIAPEDLRVVRTALGMGPKLEGV